TLCRKLSPRMKSMSGAGTPLRRYRSATGCTGAAASSAACRMRAWKTFRVPAGAVPPSGNAAMLRPARRRSLITAITCASESVLPRWWKIVPPRRAIQPTSGQRPISALATKSAGRIACSTVMSIHDPWLATNITGSCSGSPTRFTRTPKQRRNRRDQLRNSPAPAVPGFGPWASRKMASRQPPTTTSNISGIRHAQRNRPKEFPAGVAAAPSVPNKAATLTGARVTGIPAAQALHWAYIREGFAMNTTPHRVEHQQTDRGYVPIYTTATVEQPWADYTPTEHEVWATLFRRQREVLKGRACNEFLENQERFGMTPDAIPKFQDLNKVLKAGTDWEIVGVEGLLPDEIFFDHLANRRFPVTWWIRKPEQLDYLSEPDLFHDLFGHVPMLLNPVFADYVQAYGRGGVKAHGIDADALMNLTRLYWYTVEFG